MQDDHRLQLLREIEARRPKVVFLSDPCVLWCQLTELNWPFMTPVKRGQLAWEGATHCDFSALISKIQIHGGRAYAKEHPAKAKSWDRPSVLRLEIHEHVRRAKFDFCKFGMVSKVLRKPVRKRTRVQTNCDPVYQLLHEQYCKEPRKHQLVQGCEGGELRSVYAQRYPCEFCQRVASAVAQYVKSI